MCKKNGCNRPPTVDSNYCRDHTSATATPLLFEGREVPSIYWANVLHGRYWMAVGFGSAFAAALLAQLWAPLAWTIVLFVPLFAVVGLMTSPLACPKCGKRQKSGFTRCHHCGHDSA